MFLHNKNKKKNTEEEKEEGGGGGTGKVRTVNRRSELCWAKAVIVPCVVSRRGQHVTKDLASVQAGAGGGRAGGGGRGGGEGGGGGGGV